MIIAIDGLSYVGKTSIAHELSKRIDYTHINTGLYYRLLSKRIISDKKRDNNHIIQRAKKLTVDFSNNKYSFNDRYNKKIDLDLLRSKNIIVLASDIAKNNNVREIINQKIKSLNDLDNIIVEGRELTQKLFKNALWKIFIYADFETRLKRFMKVNTNDLNHYQILRAIDKREKQQFSDLCSKHKSVFWYNNSQVPSAKEDVDYLYNLIFEKNE
tara:strand:+ start:5715 stop:6356 length:642 start_codon:yes stop_codon:yes gene_type:complete